MKTRVTSSFRIMSWEEATYGEVDEGPKLTRAIVRKRFQGGLEGESLAELLMCQADPEDLAAGAGYVASERFVGRLEGRTGSFVMQHGGMSGAGRAPRSFGSVVPGSGTGELAGLVGETEIAMTPDGHHSLTLEYEIA